MPETPGEVTLLLQAASGGDTEALKRMIPLVYDELRALAARQMRAERTDHTLEATALVHEAYLRLIDQKRAAWKDRGHFLAVASTLMRRILVNAARHRRAAKRGGGDRKRVHLQSNLVPLASTPVDLVELDEALDALAARHQLLARVVEMRYFGGMSFDEIAARLEVSARTAKRYWKAAKIVLLDALSGGEDSSPHHASGDDPAGRRE